MGTQFPFPGVWRDSGANEHPDTFAFKYFSDTFLYIKLNFRIFQLSRIQLNVTKEHEIDSNVFFQLVNFKKHISKETMHFYHEYLNGSTEINLTIPNRFPYLFQ